MNGAVGVPDCVATDVERALQEDLGSGDVTASLLPARVAAARIVAREPGVLAGSPWAELCFRSLDPQVQIRWLVAEGDGFQRDAELCRISGQAAAIVSAERCALNFLQTLSATATVTREFVRAVAGTATRILDTRKTLPGLRRAQKHAVRCGGGENHRLGLFDAFLLKENHILACGSIGAAVQRARRLRADLPLIVEVENLEELREALAADVDRILIDDFSLADMRQAVRIAAGRIPLEVSGGVDLRSVRPIAETGVDYVSVGALTKHVRAIDLSLRLEERA